MRCVVLQVLNKDAAVTLDWKAPRGATHALHGSHAQRSARRDTLNALRRACRRRVVRENGGDRAGILPGEILVAVIQRSRSHS